MAKTVVGLFDNMSEAQSVVQDLVNSGFDRSDISLVASDATGEHARSMGGDRGDSAAEGAGSGAVAGTVVGGVLGLLVGIGALAIPGIGPVLAAGPLAAALGSTALGAGLGAATGGLIGGLVGAGVPEEEAGYYAEGVRRGGTLVTVSAPDNLADQAVDIMNRHGAVDIDRRAETYRQGGYTRFDTDAQPYTAEQIAAERQTYATAAVTPAATATSAAATTMPAATTAQSVNQGEVAIPIVEEDLQVGKRQVERGGVRVYSRVVETPVEETVQLREERVHVERRPVDRPVTDADAASFREGVVELTETAEVPVVSKQARVVEEVIVGKEVEQHTETVRDTVRRTDVQVEELDADETIDATTTTTGGTTTGGTTNTGGTV